MTVRPIRPDDQDALGELFANMSEESLYQRFLSVPHEIRPAMLRQFCCIDYREAMALVAVIEREGRHILVGEGRYVRENEPHFADVAFTVRDDYHGRGIGKILVRALVDVANDRGLAGFTAEILAANSVMIHIFHVMGLTVESTRRGGICSLRASWAAPPRPGLLRQCWAGFLRRLGRGPDGNPPPPKPRVWAD